MTANSDEDGGSSFTSIKLKKIVGEHEIKPILIATATPNSNGQIKRINRSLTPMLAKLSEDTRKWDRILHEAEFALNNTINRSTGDIPARLLVRVNQTGLVEDNLKLILEDQQKTERNLVDIRNSAVSRIIASQNYNKAYYDNRHKKRFVYKIGDYVMIKNVDVTAVVNKKLPKFRGPYVIKKRLDNDRHIIKDPDGYQLIQLPFEGICSPQNMKPWINGLD